MRHQRARRDNRVDHARFDQVAENEPHLADGQSARERHHHETILVAGHLLENVGGIADLPPGERRVSHRAHQLVDSAAFGQIQWKHRPEFVFYWIVKHSPGHSFLSLLPHHVSPTKINSESRIKCCLAGNHALLPLIDITNAAQKILQIASKSLSYGSC